MVILEALSLEQITLCTLHSGFHIHPGEIEQFSTKINSQERRYHHLYPVEIWRRALIAQSLDLEGEA